MRIFLAGLAGLVFLGASASTQAEPSAEPVKVMVLGSWHFAGSTSDLINVEGANVLAPERQGELETLASALAAFEPTVIVTERDTDAPDYIDPKFLEFDDEMLATVPNERVQVGYRLARLVGTDRVYGLDERPSDGEPSYFPFDKVMAHAESTGQLEELQSLLGAFETLVTEESKRLTTLSMREAMREVNSGSLSSPEFYYALLKYDQGEAQPAAELNAYWMMRNAKTFSKLEDVTEPGDRVVIVYGAGHKFWLEHFVENTPGFEVVDPVDFLTE